MNLILKCEELRIIIKSLDLDIEFFEKELSKTNDNETKCWLESKISKRCNLIDKLTKYHNYLLKEEEK